MSQASPGATNESPFLLRSGGGLLGLAAAFLLLTSIVFVDETELVIVARFGRIVDVFDQPSQRGLQWKWPWPVDTVRRFDRRVQLLTPAGREAFTRDRKNVTVEAYVLWKVADGSSATADLRPVVRFYRSLGSIEVAEARLASRLQSILTEQIGHSDLSELVAAADSESAPGQSAGPLDAVSDRIRRDMIQRDDEQESLLQRQGIEIIDVRIRRLNLPAGNMRAVFERMRSERQKIAERYRSAGLAENRMIRSQADRQAGELLARANAEAERIRGDGDADAIRILNEAHARDPEFAATLQTLDAYRQILNDKTTLILSASSSLLKLLVDGIPAPAASAPQDQPGRSDPLDAPSAIQPDNQRRSGTEAQ